MMKRMIILIIMGLTLSSCQLFTEAIKDNMYRVELARERKELSKKDGPGAIVVDKYKEDVERVIQDILKRPINKKVEFGGTTLLIPENTRLNPKHGNRVDEKTGYGIAITFEITERCSSVYYRKKIKEGLYCKIYYNGINSELNIISKKIIETNGFTNTCK